MSNEDREALREMINVADALAAVAEGGMPFKPLDSELVADPLPHVTANPKPSFPPSDAILVVWIGNSPLFLTSASRGK